MENKILILIKELYNLLIYLYFWGEMYAGFWKRLFAFIIDFFIFNLSLIILLVGIGVLFLSLGFENPINLIRRSSFPTQFFVLVMISYWSLFEASSLQATPGKLLLGMKVTDAQGGRMSCLRSFHRNLANILSFLTFYIGYLIAVVAEKKQALHDKIADTLVINKRTDIRLPDFSKASKLQLFTAGFGAY